MCCLSCLLYRDCIVLMAILNNKSPAFLGVFKFSSNRTVNIYTGGGIVTDPISSEGIFFWEWAFIVWWIWNSEWYSQKSIRFQCAHCNTLELRGKTMLRVGWTSVGFSSCSICNKYMFDLYIYLERDICVYFPYIVTIYATIVLNLW